MTLPHDQSQLTLIYDMSMYYKAKRIIRMKVSLNNLTFIKSVDDFPDKIQVYSYHTGKTKMFEFINIFWTSSNPIIKYYNADVDADLILDVLT